MNDDVRRNVNEIQAALNRLADQLQEWGLIGPNDHGTVVRPPAEQALNLLAWGIEVTHPDGGPWLCAYAGVGEDTMVATRMRGDGRYEHAVLDEDGMPTEWRTAYRPDLN
jgi:hypothetical protein